MLALLTGSLVACPPARPYDFKDEESGRQVVGVSRKCWIAQDTAVPPVIVKFDDDSHSAAAFDQLRSMPFGAEISMNVESGSSVKFVSMVPAKAAAR